jgi:hypothetical protein
MCKPKQNGPTIILISISFFVLLACNYSGQGTTSNSSNIGASVILPALRTLWDTTINNVYLSYTVKEVLPTEEHPYPGVLTILKFKNDKDTFETIIDTSDAEYLLNDTFNFEGLLSVVGTQNNKLGISYATYPVLRLTIISLFIHCIVMGAMCFIML